MLTKPQWLVILVLGGVAVALNAWNWHLSRQIGQEMGSRRAAPGLQLQELPVYDLDSAFPTLQQTEAFRAQTRQLLLYLSPTCPYCRQNLKYWQKIEERLDPQRLRLIALSDNGSDEVQLYRDALQTPILVSADRESRKANRLIRVPQTVLMDPDGKVLRNWTGDISAHLGEIQELLDISLR